MRKMRRDGQEAMVSGEVLHQDPGYITNHHRTDWLKILSIYPSTYLPTYLFFGVPSHGSVHLLGLARLHSLESLRQL